MTNNNNILFLQSATPFLGDESYHITASYQLETPATTINEAPPSSTAVPSAASTSTATTGAEVTPTFTRLHARALASLPISRLPATIPLVPFPFSTALPADAVLDHAQVAPLADDVVLSRLKEHTLNRARRARLYKNIRWQKLAAKLNRGEGTLIRRFSLSVCFPL